MSSATPDAERTPTPSSGGSSAGGSRLRRWRRGSDDSELGDLDETQAAELVRRSADTSRDQDPVSAETAEIEDEQPEDDRVVIEVPRWSEPGPTADELAALEAQREAAEAAANAATERVIAQAIASGMTDHDELPEARRGLLRRKTGYYSPAPARPVVDPAAAAAAAVAAERAQELKLPRKVRRELERATKDMTEAAAASHAAREAAERAAAVHAEQTARAEAAATQAAKGREAAEQAAREHAVQARTEAQRRTVAEQLASETVEQMTAVNNERIRVEQDAREHAAAAEAAHLARVQAEEAALRASLEREAAEARARELATSLEEARAALLEQTKATLAAEQARAAAPAPAPAPAPRRVAAPRPAPAARPPEPKIQPEGVPELVEFRSPNSSAVVTVLLGIGALVAAGIAVYEAYLDQLTTPRGIAASAVTLLLVIVVGRSKGSAGQVWLEQGVLHIDEGDSHRRFDLTSPNTKVEMVGRPGDRRWKVLFLRKGMAPYEVTSRLVEPTAFVEAITPWRPTLGG